MRNIRDFTDGFALAPLVVLGAAMIAFAATSATAQDVPAPAPPEPGATSPREVELEIRLRKMEEANRQLADQMQQLMQEVKSLRASSDGAGVSAGTAAGARPVGPATSSGGGTTGGAAPANVVSPGGNVPAYMISNTKSKTIAPLKADFGPGFQFQSENGEYQLQFHQETQLDYRDFSPNGETSARDGFVFPRVRALFNGRVTRNVDYMFSINRGFGNLDVLDAWVNFHKDDRLQLKVGRFMTPFNYEQFAIQNMWLITPERSLFTSNLGLNRQLGAMLWGTVADNHVDYAVGLFDGPRNSYEDFNDAKDVIAYLNVRPFQNSQGSWLQNLNLGGSIDYGAQDNPTVPQSFRVASNASNAGTADRYAPPFLTFDKDVVERGQRSFWSAHAAYFYRSLSLFADYNGGILRYAASQDAAASVVMPVSGMSITTGYFLTGETVERRTILDPLRPFSLKHGAFAPGAIELVARYNNFNLDDSVFTGNLADPALWSNTAWGTNLGLNWYPNRYVKVYLDWQHSEFGNPVFYASPAKKSITNDLFWLRLQFYF